MKWKRSERLVDMTYYLLEHPHQLIPLTYFSELYSSAKSSISEDLGSAAAGSIASRFGAVTAGSSSMTGSSLHAG